MINIKLNKNVIVSGGTRGIGKSIAELFLKSGSNIGVFSRNRKELNKFKENMKTKYPNRKIYVYEFDALNPESSNELTDYFNNKFKNKIDILINNVGGGGRWGNKKFEITNNNVWIEVMNKNFFIAQNLTMAFLPNMIKNKFGRVITIASVMGKEAGGRPWFNAAKAAQISLMKTLSKYKEATRECITFNTIAPGAIYIPSTGWSELKKNNLNEYKRHEKSIPVGKLGSPDDVAYITIFLSSKYANHINGACITVDGGESSAF